MSTHEVVPHGRSQLRRYVLDEQMQVRVHTLPPVIADCDVEVVYHHRDDELTRDFLEIQRRLDERDMRKHTLAQHTNNHTPHAQATSYQAPRKRTPPVRPEPMRASTVSKDTTYIPRNDEEWDTYVVEAVVKLGGGNYGQIGSQLVRDSHAYTSHYIERNNPIVRSLRRKVSDGTLRLTGDIYRKATS